MLSANVVYLHPDFWISPGAHLPSAEGCAVAFWSNLNKA